jgi:hypothetical protein
MRQTQNGEKMKKEGKKKERGSSGSSGASLGINNRT